MTMPRRMPDEPTPVPEESPRIRVVTALQRAVGRLSTAATSRMDDSLPWFGQLSAQERSWVALIVQSGIKAFVSWYESENEDPADPASVHGEHSPIAAEVFGAAPRALTGVITLQQTVDLVRLSIEVVEHGLDDVLRPDDVPQVRASVLLYAREIAFATAEVYARAAEARGAWDARLEALVVDAVLRAETDDAVTSRASALGWGGTGRVTVVIGAQPGDRDPAEVFNDVRRHAKGAGLDAICATQGEVLVVLLGGLADAAGARSAAAKLVDFFADGPVVTGPLVDDLKHAHVSARSALSARRAAPGWPGLPRPVASDQLLPERALAGDGHARRQLIDDIYRPLVDQRETLGATVSSFLDHGTSVEATARALFVHPNTVRYRLRQARDLTGLDATVPRDAFSLAIAMVLGRQSD